MGIGGNCLATRAGSLGKLMSIALREVPLEKRTSLLTSLAGHLVGTRCSKPTQGADGQCINLSCEDAIGQAILSALSGDNPKPSIEIKEHLPKNEYDTNMMVHGPCPICHTGTMITKEKTPCPTCDNPACHYKECDA